MRTGLAPFDRYSLAHAGLGAAFGLTKLSPTISIGSHVAFEAVENRLKEGSLMKKIFPESGPDTMANHVGDVASFAAGFYAARAGSRKVGVGLAALGAVVWGMSVARAAR